MPDYCTTEDVLRRATALMSAANSESAAEVVSAAIKWAGLRVDARLGQFTTTPMVTHPDAVSGIAADFAASFVLTETSPDLAKILKERGDEDLDALCRRFATNVAGVTPPDAAQVIGYHSRHGQTLAMEDAYKHNPMFNGMRWYR